MKSNKKGFTLIELIAVIIIFGILMVIAVAAISRYIYDSKVESYINTINNLAYSVKYGVISGDKSYKVGNRRVFYLTEIDLEKGDNKNSPFGSFIDSYSYILVDKNGSDYTYKVQSKDSSGYCITLTEIDKLTKQGIKKGSECDNLQEQYEYVIGDKVSFLEKNWIVLKNSSFKDNYVTLIKETVLTNSELGAYTINSVSDTSYFGNTNVYSNSTAKLVLESYMSRKSITDVLTDEVDGYKIRLITLDELISLGLLRKSSVSYYNIDVQNTPEWLYKNFGENRNNVSNYWTMTPYNGPYSGSGYRMWCMNFYSSGVSYCDVRSSNVGVRPVINLLKTALPAQS